MNSNHQDPARPDASSPATAGSLRTARIAASALAVLVAASAVVVFAVIALPGIPPADRRALDLMLALRTPQAAGAITAFTNLGRTVAMFIIALILTTALYLRYRSGWIWVLMLVTPIGSVSLTELGKAVFTRARPPFADAVAPHEMSFSFPSGHTLSSTAIAGMLAYLTCWLTQRAWVRIAAVTAAVTWSIAMGLSRIFLGHHWLSDVIFGWLAGLCWLSILIIAHQLVLRRQSRQQPRSAQLHSPS